MKCPCQRHCPRHISLLMKALGLGMHRKLQQLAYTTPQQETGVERHRTGHTECTWSVNTRVSVRFSQPADLALPASHHSFPQTPSVMSFSSQSGSVASSTHLTSTGDLSEPNWDDSCSSLYSRSSSSVATPDAQQHGSIYPHSAGQVALPPSASADSLPSSTRPDGHAPHWSQAEHSRSSPSQSVKSRTSHQPDHQQSSERVHSHKHTPEHRELLTSGRQSGMRTPKPRTKSSVSSVEDTTTSATDSSLTLATHQHGHTTSSSSHSSAREAATPSEVRIVQDRRGGTVHGGSPSPVARHVDRGMQKV